MLGAASFYLSAPSDPQRRADLLAQTNPDLLVLFPETADLLPAGLAMRVASIGADLTGSSLRLDERAASQPGAPVASLARPDDLAVVISSGGTTGVGPLRRAALLHARDRSVVMFAIHHSSMDGKSHHELDCSGHSSGWINSAIARNVEILGS